MVESVFLEKDLAGRRNTAIHNVPAFQSGRASWLDNLDRLGAIYDGALLAGLLEACSRNRNFDQLILVVSDYDVSMRKRIITSWLIAQYVGNRQAETVEASRGDIGARVAFIQLMSGVSKGLVQLVSVDRPDALDCRP